MMFAVSAKPPEWSEEKGSPTSRDRLWVEPNIGFSITYTPDDAPDCYMAAWGDGDSELCITLDAAKQWCQSTADSFTRDNAQVQAPYATSAIRREASEEITRLRDALAQSIETVRRLLDENEKMRRELSRGA